MKRWLIILLIIMFLVLALIPSAALPTGIVLAYDSQHILVRDERTNHSGDEVQINRAIQSLPGGGTVELDGTFLIEAPIIPANNIILKGRGVATEIKLANGIGGYMLSGNANHFTIQDLTFNGNGVNQPWSGGTDCDLIRVTGSWNTLAYTQLKDGNQHRGALFSGSFNSMHHNWGNSSLDARGGAGNDISYNKLAYLDPLYADAAIVFSGSTGSIAHNIVYKTNKAGILVSSDGYGWGALVIGNEVWYAALHGAYASRFPYAKFIDNLMVGCGGGNNSHAGITIDSNYALVEGNTFMDNPVGVLLQGKYNKVTNNDSLGGQYGYMELPTADYNEFLYNRAFNYSNLPYLMRGLNTRLVE